MRTWLTVIELYPSNYIGRLVAIDGTNPPVAQHFKANPLWTSNSKDQKPTEAERMRYMLSLFSQKGSCS